ncbi:MAG: hypothetical protein ACM3IJ_01860 [Candidatus Levyibacteriota bacterium]
MKQKLLALSSSAGMLMVSAQIAFADAIPTVKIQPPSTVGVNTDINSLIAFIINAIIVLGIILSLIFLLYGGVRWIMSGGDKAKVDSARGTIVAAIVGLIIVVLAYVIINAVLMILTGKSLNQGFVIPSLNSTP